MKIFYQKSEGDSVSKLSIVIPVYYNQDSLVKLYQDLKEKVLHKVEDYEIIFVDDGSEDNSYQVILDLVNEDSKVKAVKLSRNFGSHAAIFAGLSESTGDCVAIKAADMQEPSELLLDMYESWKSGNNVVLAVREKRKDNFLSRFFANLYYGIIRKIAIPSMPKSGFDMFLIDRRVIKVLELMDEKNTSIMGQVLWCGFRRSLVYYTRQKREVGKSRWTLGKKIKLVLDTVLGFSYFPVRFISILGFLFFLFSIGYLIVILIMRLTVGFPIQGWSALMVVLLFSSGTIMLTLGILGEYIWRTLDATRNRPVYIIEEKTENNDK
jgi:dolichol-phosphate mannosyltransferase